MSGTVKLAERIAQYEQRIADLELENAALIKEVAAARTAICELDAKLARERDNSSPPGWQDKLVFLRNRIAKLKRKVAAIEKDAHRFLVEHDETRERAMSAERDDD